MPLFNRTENLLKVVRQKDFALEKELQTLVENNLEEILVLVQKCFLCNLRLD